MNWYDAVLLVTPVTIVSFFVIFIILRFPHIEAEGPYQVTVPKLSESDKRIYDMAIKRFKKNLNDDADTIPYVKTNPLDYC
jgi:hypothetical protein